MQTLYIRQIYTETKTAIMLLALFTILLCGIYPFVVLAVGQAFFPDKAEGSFVAQNGFVAGSTLLAQRFTEARYFHPRPSNAGTGYDAVASGGSNLGPTSQKMIDTVKERIQQYRQENKLASSVSIPADAVTASASGLDPDISVQNALLQAGRIAQAREISAAVVQEKIHQCTEGRFWGTPHVNVLRLNLLLDDQHRGDR